MIQRSLEVVAGGDYENGTLLGIHSAQGMEANAGHGGKKKKNRTRATYIGISQHRNSLLGSNHEWRFAKKTFGIPNDRMVELSKREFTLHTGKRAFAQYIPLMMAKGDCSC